MTAIELLISISLISLIFSICFIKMKSDDYKIDLFAKQLCSDIRYVRRENMLENTTVYITFLKENGRNAYILKKNKKEDKVLYLPNNTDIDYPIGSTGMPIKFNRSGALIQGGGTITINKGNDYRYITIVPVSGRVLYKEGIYEK